MKGKTSNFEGYVIRLSDYKENDFIVTFLASDGLITFSAKGIKKPTSKNRSSIFLLAKSKVTLLEIGGSNLLKEAVLLEYPVSDGDFLLNSCYGLINELNSKIVDGVEDKELYIWLDETLKLIKNDRKFCLTAMMIYLAQFLKIEGYGLNVDSCSICSKKTDIVGISLTDGGFLCREHLEYENQKRTPRFLKIIRYCFKCNPSDISRIVFENRECLQIMSFLSELYERSTGGKLRGLEYLKMAI